MLIEAVWIKGYRNIKDINLELNRIAIFIGENNSGKSNILRAITLPFNNDEVGQINKNLGWDDINNDLKKIYFDYIEENLDNIKSNNISLDDFSKIIPEVIVKIKFKPDGADEYYIHKWCNSLEEDNPEYYIEYKYLIENHQELFDHIKEILSDSDDINNIKMNLLPIELYDYKIINPIINEKIAYNDLIKFKYNSLAAERDDFSNQNSKIGSKSLVNLLQNKLTKKDKILVEESYEKFFEDLKSISDLEKIFNWQDDSEIVNAKDFFYNITLLPNMPSMSSLLNNVKLGFGDEYLYNKGLGYRNLVYLLVMINSLEASNENVLNILTIEEPEAHLCINNQKLLSSFLNSIINKSTKTQLFISTHSSEFLNKLQLYNVVIVKEGKAFSLKESMRKSELDYLAKKPNLDFLKFLFSKKCILVEGPSEEMLIKSYLALQLDELNEIEVISLHKGFRQMLDIWLKVNKETNHRIGIIRDFDNQPTAQINHEKYNLYENIYVTTTSEYTLEPEFVKQGENYSKLKEYFIKNHGWNESDIDTEDKLSDKWRNSKAETMLRFSQDFGQEELKDIELPIHISRVIQFLKSGEKI